MSNDVKWTEWPSFNAIAETQRASESRDARGAWLQLLACTVGLALLAVALPSPRSLLGALIGANDLATYHASLGSTAQEAILATAGLVVWVLLIWSVAVCAAAAVGRLPGAPGLVGRSLLRRIAPAVAGRLVATAVGVSLLAGTSACAAPAVTALGAGSSADASSQLAGSASVPVGDGSGVVDPALAAGSTIASAAPTPTATDGVLASIVIDWPDAAGPSVSIGTAPRSNPVPTSAPIPTSNPVLTSTAIAPSTPKPPTDQTPTSVVAEGRSGTADTPVAELPSGPGTDAAPDPPFETQSRPGPAVGAAVQDHAPSSESTTAPTPGPADHALPVTVRGGDSLWSIAANRLPPGSSAAEIDSAWHAWYFANERVIGDNPDLIQPGQLLLPPTTK